MLSRLPSASFGAPASAVHRDSGRSPEDVQPRRYLIAAAVSRYSKDDLVVVYLSLSHRRE